MAGPMDTCVQDKTHRLRQHMGTIVPHDLQRFFVAFATGDERHGRLFRLRDLSPARRPL